MRTFGRRITAAIGVGALTVAIGGSALAPAGAKSKGPKAPKGPKVAVEVGDNFFEPDDLEVTAGTKVVWKNKGKILHNVRPAKGDKWGTKSLVKGKKYAYRFKKPGEYVYYCSFHGSASSGQRGTIVVKPAPTPTSTPPTTMAAG